MEQKSAITDIVTESVNLGYKFGLVLSTTYAIIGTFIVALFKDGIESFPASLILSTLAILIVVTPSMIIGGWTGMIMGTIAKSRLARQTSKTFFVSMSLLTCSLTAIFIHSFFRINIVLSFEPSTSSGISSGIFGTYPFLFGIPTIIYIIAGGWFEKTIYSRFLSSQG